MSEVIGAFLRAECGHKRADPAREARNGWFGSFPEMCLEFASLIGRSGSSTFRLSTAAVSMSLASSRFSSESAPRPLYGAFLVKKEV